MGLEIKPDRLSCFDWICALALAILIMGILLLAMVASQYQPVDDSTLHQPRCVFHVEPAAHLVHSDLFDEWQKYYTWHPNDERWERPALRVELI